MNFPNLDNSAILANIQPIIKHNINHSTHCHQFVIHVYKTYFSFIIPFFNNLFNTVPLLDIHLHFVPVLYTSVVLPQLVGNAFLLVSD